MASTMHSARITIKVANVIEEGRFGGPQNRIAEVARRLRSEGVETTVFLPKYGSEVFQSRLQRYGIDQRVIPLRKLTRSASALIAYLVFFPFEVMNLYRQFRTSGVDVVHCSGGAWQYKGLIAGCLAGKKTVWHLNDTALSGVFRVMFRLLASRCADAIIVAADRVRIYYAQSEKFEKPIFEIQAPVDTEHFSRSAVPPVRDAEENIVRLVTIGNLNILKGLEHLIEAVRLMVQQGYLVRLDLVGAVFDSQKSYYEKLRRAAEAIGDEVVNFVGGVDDVRPYLAAADIYVCSSIKEASPMSVWEAMSMEVPVVSTDVGDVPRFIEDGVSGRIVAVADPKALKEALIDMIESPEERILFAQRALVTVQNELDLAIITRRHADCYRSMLGIAGATK